MDAGCASCIIDSNSHKRLGLGTKLQPVKQELLLPPNSLQLLLVGMFFFFFFCDK